MYRVTTPTHTFTLPIQTATCDEIEVTYKQGSLVKIFHYEDNTLPEGMTLDGKDVIIKLSQTDTKAFASAFPLRVQVRVLTNDGDVFASQIFTLSVDEVLSEAVLVDEG